MTRCRQIQDSQTKKSGATEEDLMVPYGSGRHWNSFGPVAMDSV